MVAPAARRAQAAAEGGLAATPVAHEEADEGEQADHDDGREHEDGERAAAAASGRRPLTVRGFGSTLVGRRLHLAFSVAVRPDGPGLSVGRSTGGLAGRARSH